MYVYVSMCAYVCIYIIYINQTNLVKLTIFSKLWSINYVSHTHFL